MTSKNISSELLVGAAYFAPALLFIALEWVRRRSKLDRCLHRYQRALVQLRDSEDFVSLVQLKRISTELADRQERVRSASSRPRDLGLALTIIGCLWSLARTALIASEGGVSMLDAGLLLAQGVGLSSAGLLSGLAVSMVFRAKSAWLVDAAEGALHVTMLVAETPAPQRDA